jgi:hypothetical protein
MSKAKKAAALARDHNKHNVDAIGAELRKRTDIFEIGELLTRAKKLLEHGDWLPWLALYWPHSEDTAERRMRAYRFAEKFRSVRNVRVAPGTIERLIDFYDNHDPDLPKVIEALVRKSKTAEKPITVAAADKVIELTTLEIEYGSFPPATLYAIYGIDKSATWANAAIKALKRAAPTSDVAAEQIVRKCRSKFEAKQADQKVEREDSQQVDGEQAKEPPPTPASMLPPASSEPLPGEILLLPTKTQTEESDQQQAKAVAEANADVGGKAEFDRLTVRVEELEREKSRLEKARAADGREIERLQGELKETPQLSLDKLTNALIAALKSTKVSREKAELTIERICAELKIDPSKLNVANGKDKVAAQSAELAPSANVPTEPPLQSSDEAPLLDMPTGAIDQWQIKAKKYVKGWSWFATDGSVSLNSNAATLFATQEEAEANARAVIAGVGQERPAAIAEERRQ